MLRYARLRVGLMVTVDKAVIARLEKNGRRFEILVDPELAYQFREGKTVSFRDLLAVDEIFKDARKGETAARSDLLAVFGTTEIEEVAKRILKEGEVQITAEFRRRKLEEKKRRIAEFISKNAMDPRTKTTIPIQRILNAMEQAKVHIDLFKPVEEQVNEVIQAIRSVIPLSLEKLRIEVRVPPAYAARCYGILKGFNASLNYANDGTLVAKLEIPAGLRSELYQKLSSIARGEITIKEEGGAK